MMKYLIPAALFTLTALFCFLAERARRKYRAEMRKYRWESVRDDRVRPGHGRDTVRR